MPPAAKFDPVIMLPPPDSLPDAVPIANAEGPSFIHQPLKALEFRINNHQQGTVASYVSGLVRFMEYLWRGREGDQKWPLVEFIGYLVFSYQKFTLNTISLLASKCDPFILSVVKTVIWIVSALVVFVARTEERSALATVVEYSILFTLVAIKLFVSLAIYFSLWAFGAPLLIAFVIIAALVLSVFYIAAALHAFGLAFVGVVNLYRHRDWRDLVNILSDIMQAQQA